ncbi:MAG: 3-phosphoshikimate 1-carboxyvinyltransferase [Woeseiaceae bacterium]|nr:3-phosphoshikimate 1-carboxyvinyltransferase [Woeseiaceae bacterium]
MKPSAVHDATVTVPGDKSISHRALMLGSIAEGRTEISGFLNGEDCLATLAAMAAMHVSIEQPTPTDVVIHGGGLEDLHDPGMPLDLGNSGTAMRLMSGLLCGQAFDVALTGDESLSGRPMNRVIVPLSQMGAVIESDDGCPPLRIRGQCELEPIHYDMPVASAQVKSAILLAGLYADGETSVTEPAITRDHTERMLVAMGAAVSSENGRITIQGRPELKGRRIQVPGDLSSAAFVMLAVLLSESADVVIENVGINPTRTGVIDILLSMGADLSLENERKLGEEPVADIRVRSSALKGCAVDPALVSLAIDEFPVLFVAAAAAEGSTTFSGIGELRVKESDRIAAMAAGLRELGIRVDESEDGAVVQGGRFKGGTVQSFGDHRIAMSLAIAGTVADSTVTVLDTDAVATSFPGFTGLFRSMGATIEEAG